jgi:thymidylate synthase (FAD)
MQKTNIDVLNFTPKGDLLVVNAARCSFDKQHEEFDEEKDRKLLNYLAREQHVLPFRHPVATLRITCPIFVLRQLGKHQVGFSWSEVSRRYITGEPEFWMPNDIRSRPDNIKQGSESKDWGDNFEALWHQFDSANREAMKRYEVLLGQGVAPEQARAVLPQSMYTTCVVTGTLLGWHHLWKLRTEEHTQLETQEYAQEIGFLMEQMFPESWRALCTHS